jgi:hypothetical protein
MYRNFFWHSIEDIEIKEMDHTKNHKVTEDKQSNDLLTEKENIETL